MFRFIVGRLGTFVVLVFLASIAIFYLVHLLPGNPAQILVGDGTAKQVAQESAALGLSKPLYQQYALWAWHMLQGNFGRSFITNDSVRSTIASALPIDIEIALISQTMALSTSIPAAIYAARHPNGFLDRIFNSVAFVFFAIPYFVSLVFLQNILAVNLHVPDVSPAVYSPGGDWVTNLLVLILPSFIVSTGSFVIYFRILRSDLITTFLEDFITMAKSKGLSRRRIVYRHAFRPSSLSLIGVFALVMSGLIGGVVVVEFICVIPGMGYELIYGAGGSDYIVVQGITMVVTFISIAMLIFVDVLNHFIDPRVSLE
jgi:peptide/nickel transport system permease protein